MKRFGVAVLSDRISIRFLHHPTLIEDDHRTALALRTWPPDCACFTGQPLIKPSGMGFQSEQNGVDTAIRTLCDSALRGNGSVSPTMAHPRRRTCFQFGNDLVGNRLINVVHDESPEMGTPRCKRRTDGLPHWAASDKGNKETKEKNYRDARQNQNIKFASKVPLITTQWPIPGQNYAGTPMDVSAIALLANREMSQNQTAVQIAVLKKATGHRSPVGHATAGSCPAIHRIRQQRRPSPESCC